MKTFAKRLKEAREQSGLTQEQLADKIGVTRQAVSRWEQDITQPDMEMVVTLSDVLQVNVETLAFGKSNQSYQRFQKKHLVGTVVAFGCALVVLLLMVFLDPIVKGFVHHYDFDSFLYFWLFRLLLPPAGFFALGLGAAALVSLFYDTCPGQKWRNILFALGLIAIAPSLLVLIDAALGIWIPGYSIHITFALYMKTVALSAVQTLLYKLFPMAAGILCYLGINKK